MGHMTQIANRLHIAVETRQEVAEHVQDSNQWQDYFTTHLAPRNEVGFLVSILLHRDLPHSLLCSKHDSHLHAFWLPASCAGSGSSQGSLPICFGLD